MIKLIIFSFLFSTHLFAHEGHADVSAKSQHGGVIKKTENYYVEVLQDEKSWSVFVMDHFYKITSPSKMTISGELEVKNLKKGISLKQSEDHYTFTDGLKNEKHFKLNLKLNNQNKTEQVSFNLEPQGN